MYLIFSKKKQPIAVDLENQPKRMKQNTEEAENVEKDNADQNGGQPEKILNVNDASQMDGEVGPSCASGSKR